MANRRPESNSRMNRRYFLMNSMVATAAAPLSVLVSSPLVSRAAPAPGEPRVAVLLVDTDRAMGSIDERIYGHFLEHINHSVEDGLFAEQIRGAGFEGDDFNAYWTTFSAHGAGSVAAVDFQNGKKSVRIDVNGVRAGIRQDRIYIESGYKYEGSLWVKREAGSPELTLRVLSSTRSHIASMPLPVSTSDWHEVPFSFASPVRDTDARIEASASGTGAL